MTGSAKTCQIEDLIILRASGHFVHIHYFIDIVFYVVMNFDLLLDVLESMRLQLRSVRH